MKQYTERYTVMISPTQSNSLKVLKSKGINTSQFTRQAIKEKLQREWKGIKEKSERIKDAPDWLYD